jgi:hypothetical protein
VAAPAVVTARPYPAGRRALPGFGLFWTERPPLGLYKPIALVQKLAAQGVRLAKSRADPFEVVVVPMTPVISFVAGGGIERAGTPRPSFRMALVLTHGRPPV